MSAESTVQRQVWLGMGRKSVLFRLNTGKAWVSGGAPVYRLKDGAVVVPAGRMIALGFSLANTDPVKGSSDLIGYTPVEITAAMVGKTIAVFTAIETKKSKNGKTSADQLNFIKQVKDAGGIAGVANSPEAGNAIIEVWMFEYTQGGNDDFRLQN